MKGEALQIINSVPITPENYDLAYNAIINRYSNKRRLATYYFNEIATFELNSKPSYEGHQRFLSAHNNAISVLELISEIDLKDFLLFSLAYNYLDPETKY